MKNSLKIKTTFFYFLIAFFGVLFFAFNVNATNAASLYFSPSSGNFNVGNIFTVSALVNTNGEAINNADATISFPTDLLEVVSISKSGSIFSLWVEEPSFSNGGGAISFNGGVPTPGFTGTAGKLVSVVFRVKSGGTASVIFSSGAVRANDGYGTNVLTSRGQAQFNLIGKEGPPKVPPPEVTPPTPGVPNAPRISSPTHPDPEKWYSNSDPKLTWEVPSGITGTRLSFGTSPSSVPNVSYPNPISERQLEDLADGIWYFNVQLQNKIGWGKTSNFKMQIDTKPPLPFEITVKEGKETTYAQPTLLFEAKDESSGIDYYEVKIDLGASVQTKEAEYKMPVQGLGKHTVIVKAVDKTGNSTLAMIEIDITPIEAPVITHYPSELLPDSILSVKGKALPDATIKLYVQKDEKEIKLGETKSDKDGNWTYINVEPVEDGVYQVWAETVDSSGATSQSSNKVTILVSPPPFLKIGRLAIDYLTTIMTLIILILAIISIIFWFWLLFKKKRKDIRDEISEAEEALHEAFKVLRNETENQVAKLDGKPDLSVREKEIRDKLTEALNSSEKLIGKKIKAIKEEVE